MSEGAIRPRTIHVWAGTVAATFDMDGGLATLDTDERRRAAAFVFDRDRRRFVARRRALRQVLGRCLHVDPAQLAYSLAANHRPVLKALPASAADAIGQTAFNTSHSGDEFVIAVLSDGGPVGIDIEAVRDIDDLESLARSVCSAGELGQLSALSDRTERSRAFFRCWSRKEAYLKATGLGLVDDLAGIDVGVEPGERCIAPIAGLSPHALWLRSLPRQDDMAMAVCSLHRAAPVQSFDLPD